MNLWPLILPNNYVHQLLFSLNSSFPQVIHVITVPLKWGQEQNTHGSLKICATREAAITLAKTCQLSSFNWALSPKWEIPFTITHSIWRSNAAAKMPVHKKETKCDSTWMRNCINIITIIIHSKYFSDFWSAITFIIHHNQLQLIKFGRILSYCTKSMMSKVWPKLQIIDPRRPGGKVELFW